MKKAVVIIPTYNEKNTIPKTLAAVLAVFDTIQDWEMHVLVVDDTSPDKTYEVVESWTKKDRRVHLFLNPQKAGLGGAYLKGMAEAFDTMSADLVFEFDADLQHDPLRIPALLAKIDQGYDLVLGSRYIKGGSIPATWAWHRKLLSISANILIMFVFANFQVRDWTAGYRAITKKVYQAVHPEMHGDRFTGYTFQVGFLHKTVRKGFKVGEVPIHFADRTEGHSKLGGEYIKNTLIYIFKVRFQEIISHRIFKFAVVGGTGAAVQLLSLTLWRLWLPYQFAFFASIESAVVSNFILNNVWTFSDRKLQVQDIPSKFVQFNLASSGSILIQQGIAIVGEFAIGLHPLFIVPFTQVLVDTGHMYAIAGIFIGMFWNFFAYSTFIWKAGAKKSASKKN